MWQEASNQILHILYNLCRLNKARQTEVALMGAVPILQQIVLQECPIKELALSILCDLAQANAVCRKVLWQNDGLEFYLHMMYDQIWKAPTFEAITVWFGHLSSL